MTKGKQARDLHLFDRVIQPGESAELKLSFAKLHTQGPVEVPIIVERAKQPGPTLLITAGIHGDEVNGVEIVRQLIAKGINKPKTGTTICLPVVNIFGFIQKVRELPDGRDLNRSFPGSRTGSLASRMAYKITNYLLPHVDYCLDFHTGGSSRFNAPHIRVENDDPQLMGLAREFNAPFILESKNLKKTFRSACRKNGVPMLLFEGGKSNYVDKVVSNAGVNGSKRVLHRLGMLKGSFKVSKPRRESVIIIKSKWIRAQESGMFKSIIKVGSFVEKGQTIGQITDPYGKTHSWVKASNDGYVFNVNESPLIYQGDALFHISTEISL
jgi:predicted deacylase